MSQSRIQEHIDKDYTFHDQKKQKIDDTSSKQLFFSSVKNGITLVELLIVIIIIGFSLASIIGLVNLGIKAVDKTRSEVVGINLAREGIEGVYQIRNTNRQRRGGDKDACWLKINPLVDEGSPGCINDAWMESGFYIISLTGTTDRTYIMTDSPQGFNLSAFNAARDEPFSLCVLDGVRSPCQAGVPSQNTSRYFRQVRGLGLFNKTTTELGGTAISCPTGATTNCADFTAKEYRFCVDVGYQGLGIGNIQLCSVLTNFRQ